MNDSKKYIILLLHLIRNKYLSLMKILIIASEMSDSDNTTDQLLNSVERRTCNSMHH